MKAIVFGGSGFLGSHVADVLAEEGFKVTIFDIKDSPFLGKGQKMVRGDILDQDLVKRAIKGMDYVYNFAGIADMDDASTKAADTLRLNVAGNLNILDAAVAEGVTKFIYASSIYVYSQKGGFYRCSKQASEIYIEEYNRRYGLKFLILRFGSLYGPRANKHNSVQRYLNDALKKGVITVDGIGDELREYIHVRDAARLSVDVLNKKYLNQHIIITGHHPIRFRDMLMTISEIVGKKIKVKFTGKENKDHYCYTPYSFIPKIGNKLVNNCYTDLGQGFLECLHEIHKNGK